MTPPTKPQIFSRHHFRLCSTWFWEFDDYNVSEASLGRVPRRLPKRPILVAVLGKVRGLLRPIDGVKGQLVMDTNLTRQQFMNRFGETAYRRVKQLCNMREYGF